MILQDDMRQEIISEQISEIANRHYEIHRNNLETAKTKEEKRRVAVRINRAIAAEAKEFYIDIRTVESVLKNDLPYLQSLINFKNPIE